MVQGSSLSHSTFAFDIFHNKKFQVIVSNVIIE